MNKLRIIIAVVLLGLTIEISSAAAMGTANEDGEVVAPSVTLSKTPALIWTPVPESPDDEAVPVTVGLNDWPGPGAIRATWLDPQVSGDRVSIPLREVMEKRNVHFKLAGTQDGDLEFMAYEVNGKIYLRSGACPPCHLGYTLDGNWLYCNACFSVFNALTGKGLRGGCVVFPKSSVRYEIKDGRIEMRYIDLIIAERLTLKPDYKPRIKDATHLY